MPLYLNRYPQKNTSIKRTRPFSARLQRIQSPLYTQLLLHSLRKTLSRTTTSIINDQVAADPQNKTTRDEDPINRLETYQALPTTTIKAPNTPSRPKRSLQTNLCIHPRIVRQNNRPTVPNLHLSRA